jgi:hypothetical protein
VTQSPEKKAEYNRNWYLRNRERVIAQQREYYERNKEAVKKQRAAYYAEHRDELRVSQREYVARNSVKVAQYQRDYRNRNRERLLAASMAERHGPLATETWAELWKLQEGRCYLCGDPLGALPPKDVHIDHDHRCCPRDRSCPACRRGIACRDCNVAIGYANDDPDRLRRMADALEAAQLAIRQRMAAAGSEQLQFPSEEITR